MQSESFQRFFGSRSYGELWFIGEQRQRSLLRLRQKGYSIQIDHDSDCNWLHHYRVSRVISTSGFQKVPEREASSGFAKHLKVRGRSRVSKVSKVQTDGGHHNSPRNQGYGRNPSSKFAVPETKWYDQVWHKKRRGYHEGLPWCLKYFTEN